MSEPLRSPRSTKRVAWKWNDNDDTLGVVVIVPIFSVSDFVNLDSCYVYLRTVLPVIARLCPDSVFLVLFPDPEYGNDAWRYIPDEFERENIILLKWPFDTAMRSTVIGFDPVRFARLESCYGPTVYWLHMVELGPMVHSGYQSPFSSSSQPTIVAQHHYIIHRSLPYPQKSMFKRLWMQMGGSIAADTVVYNSDHCRRMARESFGNFLNESSLQDLEEKSVTLRFGLVLPSDPVAPPATKDDAPIFLYNHRFQCYKQHEITFNIFRQLRQDFDFEVWITHPPRAQRKTLSGVPVRALHLPRRDDYLQTIAVPAINTMNSVHETFCISILDSMSVGHLLVLPRSLTFPELLPQDYPYLFTSPNEQLVMLKEILATWPSPYNIWRERLIEHARKNFSVHHYAQAYVNILKAAEARHRRYGYERKTFKNLGRVFLSLKPNHAYNLRDIHRVVHQTIDLGSQAFPPRRTLREAIRLAGARVAWDRGIRLIFSEEGLQKLAQRSQEIFASNQ